MTIDSAGVLHLTGTVDVGPAAGMPVDVTAQLDPRRLNGHGLIRFLAMTARR